MPNQLKGNRKTAMRWGLSTIAMVALCLAPLASAQQQASASVVFAQEFQAIFADAREGQAISEETFAFAQGVFSGKRASPTNLEDLAAMVQGDLATRTYDAPSQEAQVKLTALTNEFLNMPTTVEKRQQDFGTMEGPCENCEYKHALCGSLCTIGFALCAAGTGFWGTLGCLALAAGCLAACDNAHLDCIEEHCTTAQRGAIWTELRQAVLPKTLL